MDITITCNLEAANFPEIIFDLHHFNLHHVQKRKKVLSSEKQKLLIRRQ